jgi:Leucine-rich repeat (LRR) protein
MADDYLRRIERRLKDNPGDETLQHNYFREMGHAGELKIVGDLELLPDEYERLEELTAEYERDADMHEPLDITARHGYVRTIKKKRDPLPSGILTLPPFYYLQSFTCTYANLDRLHLPKLPHLETLYLWNNHLGAEGTRELHLPANLRSLNIENNRLGAEGAKNLILPAELQNLYIDGNNLGPEGAKNLRLPPNLKVLEMSSNEIGPDGARHLALPLSLRELTLIDNQLGPQGIKNLKLPPFLEYLAIADNYLWAQGAVHLNLPPSLQELYIYDNQLSAQNIQELQETYPELKIHG